MITGYVACFVTLHFATEELDSLQGEKELDNPFPSVQSITQEVQVLETAISKSLPENQIVGKR
jgi:hypothetical protein